jgi:hypothetical protein
LKKRTWTRISNSFVRSLNAPRTSGVPSTAKIVWISCSLPSPSYAVRTRFPGILFLHLCVALFLIFLRTFSDLELPTVFVNLTTCSLTLPTTLIRAHRPLTLKLSMSQHLPPQR